MNDKTHDADTKVSARRRLVRGVFAAPAVLTMYSGGALAQASATCVAKAQNAPVTAGVMTYTPSPTPPPDTFLRIRLWVSTNQQRHWLRYDQISAFTGATNIIATSNNYREFLVSSNMLSSTETNVSNPQGNLSASNSWAALRFDGTGALVGVGATGGGSAITGSCWTSTLKR